MLINKNLVEIVMIYDDIYLNETGALLEERLPYSRSFYATIGAG